MHWGTKAHDAQMYKRHNNNCRVHGSQQWYKRYRSVYPLPLRYKSWENKCRVQYAEVKELGKQMLSPWCTEETKCRVHNAQRKKLSCPWSAGYNTKGIESMMYDRRWVITRDPGNPRRAELCEFAEKRIFGECRRKCIYGKYLRKMFFFKEFCGKKVHTFTARSVLFLNSLFLRTRHGVWLAIGSRWLW